MIVSSKRPFQSILKTLTLTFMFAAMFTAIAGETVHRVGQDGVEPPKFTHRVAPKYPESAIRDQIEGYLILEAILRADGSFDDIKVLKTMGQAFSDSAIEALKQWEFEPGTKDGVACDVRMTLKIDFVLDGKKFTLTRKSWKPVNDEAWTEKPKATMMQSEYKKIRTGSMLETPVTVMLDPSGNLMSFEFDETMLERFREPETLYNQIESALNQLTFEPAKNEGEGLMTQIEIVLPLAL